MSNDEIIVEYDIS